MSMQWRSFRGHGARRAGKEREKEKEGERERD